MPLLFVGLVDLGIFLFCFVFHGLRLFITLPKYLPDQPPHFIRYHGHCLNNDNNVFNL